jgi:hypothetical protein
MIELHDVKYEDKNAEVQLLEMAMQQVGLGLHYAHVELITKVMKKLKEKGGDFNLEDGTTLKHEWERDWSTYFNKQKRAEFEELRTLKNKVEGMTQERNVRAVLSEAGSEPQSGSSS